MRIIYDNRRTLLKKLNNDFFKKGVEIGVRTGWYSKYILESTKMQLDCIDPWEFNSELVDPTGAYDFCKKLLSPHSDRCRMIKEYSPQAASKYEDESLDFVYIDALHDYESVKKDMRAWYSKVRKGGILSGHDYHQMWLGVIKAVDEFCLENKLELQLTGIVGNKINSNDGNIDEWDGDAMSWVIIK